MKFILGTLVVLLGMLFQFSAFAWSENRSLASSDEETYYELVYTECVNRYEASKLSNAAVDCLCLAAAENAVKSRNVTSDQPVAALDEEVEGSCVSR